MTNTNHDSLCSRRESKKSECVCSIIAKARFQGYESAIRETSWECSDCGNVYGFDVIECPNRTLDELAVASRVS